MTKIMLLNDLKELIEDAVKNLLLPTSVQKGDTEKETRAPEVHKMRLPKSSDAKKKAPYIIIQFIKGTDRQSRSQTGKSTAVIRFIFCVFSDDEEEGALMLLNVMETVRIRLMKTVVIGDYFKLDLDEGLDSLAYPDDTAPYYAGEMIGVFETPSIEREVQL